MIAVRGRPEHDVHRQAAELLVLTAPVDGAPAAAAPRSSPSPRSPDLVMSELRIAWARSQGDQCDPAAAARVNDLRVELAQVLVYLQDGSLRRGQGAGRAP